MSEPSKIPTLAQIQKEVALYVLALGALVNECVAVGAGCRMLGLPEDASLQGAVAKFDASSIRMARHLPVYYEYAYEARVPAGHESTINPDDVLAELLCDFPYSIGAKSDYLQLCLDVVGAEAGDTGHLEEMVERWKARYALDHGQDLTTRQIAVLADMNERSVQNATLAKGAARLRIGQDGWVNNTEAKRWIEGRRGFKKTTFRDLPKDSAVVGEQLSAAEIPAFVADRILHRFGNTQLDETIQHGVLSGGFETTIPEHVEKAAKTAGLDSKVVARAMQSPLSIEPKDCEPLARLMGIDPGWFTLQVMQALYPAAMSIVLNPGYYAAERLPSLPAAASELEIELTASMIKHGYIDFPAHAAALFPEDSFGDRSRDGRGKEIELVYGSQSVSTDIRRKSERVISPRKRFAGWLNAQIHAKAGDRLRLKRLAPRRFELIFVPATSA